MSPAASRRGKHRYRVLLREYSTYEVIVEAPDATTAEELAEQLREDDPGGLVQKDGGVDSCVAELIREEAPQ